MKVDFNKLRVSASRNMGELIDFLNNRIDSDGRIEFNAEELEDIINDLRMHVVVISAVFNEDNKDFADVSREINIPYFTQKSEG